VSDAAAVVRDRLLNVAAVTALVSTRIYTQNLPQSVTLPAVLVERVDESQASHLRGGSSLMVTRVQVSSVAATRAAAEAVDAAIQGDRAGSALSHWAGTAGSPGTPVRWVQPFGAHEDYDPDELRQYRINRDFRVHHT
jgi:hypothetical protein